MLASSWRGDRRRSAPAALDELARLGSVWEFALELAEGERSVARLFDHALDVLGGRLDVLFHVAGISGRKLGDAALHECSSEAWVQRDADQRPGCVSDES